MAEVRSHVSRRPGLLAVGLALLALLAPMPHARAGVCSGQYTLSADMTTVMDNGTHLRWQRHAPAKGMLCWDGSGNGCSTWQGAKDYCQSLPLDGGGWRLPHIFELQTLVDESQAYPAPHLNPTAFPPKPAGHYWSSSASVLLASTHAWSVNFDDGSAGDDAMKEFMHIRCVR